jgi:hypothetical protein
VLAVELDLANPFASPPVVDPLRTSHANAEHADVAREGDLVVIRAGAKVPRCFLCNGVQGVEYHAWPVLHVRPGLVLRVLVFVFLFTALQAAGGVLGQPFVELCERWLGNDSLVGGLASWLAGLKGPTVIPIMVVAAGALLTGLRRASVAVTLCASHSQQARRRGRLAKWLVTPIMSFALLYAISHLIMTRSLNAGLAFWGVFALALVIVAAVKRFGGPEARITAKRIEGDTVWLAGAGPEFLASLPPARVGP